MSTRPSRASHQPPPVIPSHPPVRPLTVFREPLPPADGGSAQTRGRALRANADDFGPGGISTLHNWAREAGIQAPSAEHAVPMLATYVVQLRSDVMSAQGGLALRSLVNLGLMSEFNMDLLLELVMRFGPKHLERANVLYNGHATQAMFPLVPTLQALGAASVASSYAPYSGTQAMDTLLHLQSVLSGGTMRVEPAANQPEKMREHEEKTVEMIRRLADQAELRGEVALIDKGAVLAKYLEKNPDERILGQIRAGTLRFLAHNSDDLRGLQSLEGQAIVIDLNSSRIKALEARIIGEQFALMGIRQAREMGTPGLKDVAVYQLGYGLIGREIPLALKRLGLPPERICVIEPDDAKRAEAAAEGFRVKAHADEPEPDGTRPERALVYVATPGVGLDAANLHAFARMNVVMAATSGGKGVDLPSMLAEGAALETRPHFRGMGDSDVDGTSGFSDWLVSAPGGPEGEQSQHFILTQALPVNLIDESWPDRFGVTSSIVTVGAVEAMQHDEPGVYPVSAELEDLVWSLYEERGMLAIRPLDPRTEHPAEWAALCADVTSLSSS